MITREAAGTILTHAGPEIGVASTKAFTGQLTALMLLAMYLGQVRGTLTEECEKRLLQEVMRVPHKMETVLQGDENRESTKTLARQFFSAAPISFTLAAAYTSPSPSRAP